jgi:signal transduction histidine kinase
VTEHASASPRPATAWPGGAWRARRRHLASLGVLFLALFEVVGTFGAADHQTGRDLGVLAILLVVAGPLSLLFLRRQPLLAIGLVVAATLGYLARGYPYGPVVIAPAIALFAGVLMGHRVASWVGFGCLYVGHFAARAWLLDDKVTWGMLLGVAAWGLVVLSLAEVVRVRRERMAVSFAARREARHREANEERLRIARELHDVVAHHMSLINVQASVALHLVDRRPEQVQTALSVIKDASKEALVEMRSLVGVLRDEEESAPRAPAAMLDSLDDLVERGAVAGLTIRVRTVGKAGALPAAVELAAYRIIQEAVTNVVRHADAQTADITLDHGERQLRVRIDDDGKGLPGDVRDNGQEWDGSGSGLRGMRERAAALGGTLTLGRSPAGGVRIEAVLPSEPTR